MKYLHSLSRRAQGVWKAFCSWLYWKLFEATHYKMFISFIGIRNHAEVLKKRIARRDEELCLRRAKQQVYGQLRILTKATFSHGENVRYVGRTEVKIKLPKQLHDDILEKIKELEQLEAGNG